MDSRISARALATALGGWRTREPAYEALADGIRLLCVDNRIPARTTLPAERELAAALQVSRTTVAAAYASLRATSHITSVRGSGSVSLPLPRRSLAQVPAAGDAIDLQQASPPAWPGLVGVIAEVAGTAASIVARAGYDVVGDAGLRALIADRYTAAGVATTAENILVTTGAQSAIHLLATVLVGRGDRVIVETPTYPHAAEALRRAGGRLVGVPVTPDDGWDLDRAEQAFARTMPVMAYLMPDFQNPTGRSMSVLERTTLRAVADRAGTVLVVDETTAQLAIDRPAAVAHDAFGDRVVRIGSLGKTVWGGLRVGWIRAEVDLIRRLIAARPAYELGTAEFEQAVARTLLPRFDAIVAQRSDFLRAGRDALTGSLREALPEWRIPDVDGGVSLWVELDAPLSTALVMDVRTRGLLLSAGPRFAVDGGHERRLRLPFTAPVADLHRAAGILAEAWPRVRQAAPAGALATFEPVI